MSLALALYSTGPGVAQPPPTTASAPPPVATASAPSLGPPHQPSVLYQQLQQLQPAGIELQQYAMPTTCNTAASTAQSTVPLYTPNIPSQAVYPNEPIYNPGMAPCPPTTMDVAGGDPNQGYTPPPTKINE